jgi:hypothetical protein
LQLGSRSSTSRRFKGGGWDSKECFLYTLFPDFCDPPFLFPSIKDFALLNGEVAHALVINLNEVSVIPDSGSYASFD